MVGRRALTSLPPASPPVQSQRSLKALAGSATTSSTFRTNRTRDSDIHCPWAITRMERLAVFIS